MQKEKILVTGATGFIGKKLTRRLVAEGHDVVCTGRRFSKLLDISESIKFAYLDIRDKNAVKNIIDFEKPDAVYHCAAMVDNRTLSELRRENVDGTRNVLEACFGLGVKRVIYLSSIAVISGNTEIPLTEGLPLKATNRYGQSKLEAEIIAKEFRAKGLKIAIIRPPMVYGEGEPHMLPLLYKLAKMRLIPMISNSEKRLHMVYVQNVVDVLMLCLEKEKAYEGTYIVADNEALTFGELIGYMTGVMGIKPAFRIPAQAVLLFRFLPVVGRSFQMMLKDRVYSIDAIKNDLGYTPRFSFYEGMKRTALSFNR